MESGNPLLSRVIIAQLETASSSRHAMLIRDRRMPFRSRLHSATNLTEVSHATQQHVNTGMPALPVRDLTHEWLAQPVRGHALEKTQQLSLVNPEELYRLLQGYPEHERAFLIQGFREGFKIQHHGPRKITNSKNHGSAAKNANIVTRLLSREISLGRIAGPFDSDLCGSIKISPLGLIPKKEPGSYRLIHDLSFPPGNSVNDGISRSDSTVQYENFDTVVELVKKCGRNALMAKCDVEEAFRQLPVHPSDYHLLGFTWMGKIYFDKRLAMGCASSCQIFERFSCALQWLISKYIPGAMVSHILDDFIFVGCAGSSKCWDQLHSFLGICAQIGLPIKDSKTVYPCTDIAVHGLQLNSATMIASLPADKINKAITQLLNLSHKKKISLLALQSICGLLNFACKAVVPGRPFLRRMINLTIGLSKPFHHARVNREVRADAHAWIIFFQSFNGKSMFLNDPWLSSETLQLGTDASNIGYSAVYGSKWFAGHWPMSWSDKHITVKEIFPIVLALQIWAPVWKNHKIRFICDNMAVVEIINSQSCKDAFIMHFVRKLVVTSLVNNILFRAQHIAGRDNKLCDQLSRDMFQEARQTAPWLDTNPTQIPPAWLPN
jgi:hypothetical protein